MGFPNLVLRTRALNALSPRSVVVPKDALTYVGWTRFRYDDAMLIRFDPE
jgi:hypothetical protein